MKNLLYNTLLLLSFTCIVFSCRPDETGEIMEPLSKIEGIQGTWKINTVTQVDEIRKNQGDLVYSMDLTDLFGFKEVTATFNVDGQGTPSTFTLTNPAGAPEFFLLEGTWRFDNPEFPTKILLFQEGIEEAVNELALSRVPAKGYNLELLFQRFEGDKLYLSYHYNFQKVND